MEYSFGGNGRKGSGTLGIIVVAVAVAAYLIFFMMYSGFAYAACFGVVPRHRTSRTGL